jgi:hypothetical protein
MIDRPADGSADTPGPEATAEQDADVRALLAFLRDEPMEMPADVAARLDAVIAEERRTSAAAAAAAMPLDDRTETSATRLAPVTVLPVATRRGPSMRAFTVVGGIAAAALVVVGGLNLLGGLGSSTSRDSASTAGAASSAPSAAPSDGVAAEGSGGTRLTASGATYTAKTLSAQAATLAGISLGTVKATDRTAALSGSGTDATGESAPAPGATPATAPQSTTGYTVGAAPTDARALAAAALTPEKVTACVGTLTDGDGTQALAVDAGTWLGTAALMVILPTKGDTASLDVIVVTRDCSPNFLTFQRIPRP